MDTPHHPTEWQQEYERLYQHFTNSEEKRLLITSIIDLFPSAVYLKDHTGSMVHANQCVAEILQIPYQQLFASHQGEPSSTHTDHILFEHDDVILQTGNSIEKEMYIPHPDQTTHTYESLKYPVRKPDNTIIGMVAIFRDITEFREMEETLQEVNIYLENRLADQAQQLQQSQALLKAVLNYAPFYIYVKDSKGRYLLANRQMERLYDKSNEDIIGKTDYDFMPPQEADALRANDQAVISERRTLQREETLEHLHGQQHIYLSIKFPLYDSDGIPNAVCGISTDVTKYRHNEEERLRLQQEIIGVQRALLHEISTPLIPLTDDVLLMPLVGTVDSQRAQHIMETLLDGISRHNAHTAILDITGVPVVDTQVANALIQAAQAAKLLGAHIILTGIGPSMAETLISLGADLSEIATPGTVQQGISYAFGKRIARTLP
jgi:PAS domain S-box-containing protein